jgi:response regulator RpfG family c-di-GMP phosphodiesterase
MASVHNTLQKFDAILIDPDMSTRMRLKQVCSSVVNFGKVHPLGTLNEANQKLKTEGSIDVIFLSHHFDQESIGGFIKECKTLPSGQDSAYILVLKNNESQSSSIATSMMIGADGVLFEPYSVEQLVEITLLSAKVRKERSQAREEAALKFLINDMMQQVDILAYSRSCGYETGPAFKHFKQVCGVLNTLEPESLVTYHRLVVDMFENAPLPAALYQRKKYGGASNRIKKRMAEKIAAEVEKIGSDKPSLG